MSLFKHWKRRRIRRKPFPENYREILGRNVSYYNILPQAQKQKLQELILIFLNEKNFEGCGGLQITDEIKVTIAAQACILLLGEISDFYPSLRSVLIYPHRYVAPFKNYEEGGVVIEGQQYRLGESWSEGNVVLAWDEVKKGASDINDGQNLVFHEFAHQLDHEYGASNQIQSSRPHSAFLTWARILGAEYDKLIQNIEQRHHTLIDAYGASNPAEFFAVVSELFFEKPALLKKRRPELYEQLKGFYRQDTASYKIKKR